MVKIKLPSYWILLQVLGLAGLAISIPSCSKSSQTITDSTCITRVVTKATDYQVSAADLQSILALFKANQLSTANLQFLSYSTYYDRGIALGYPGSPGYIGPAALVWATPFFNGLPAWVGGEFFTFDAGKYQPGGTYDGYTGPIPTAYITNHQTLSNLRVAFLAHVSESGTVGGANNSPGRFPYSASDYADSCLLVTLGYIDASMIPGSTTPPETALVKVWSVTPLQEGLPTVNVEDDNGLAWGVVVAIP
jgi:hypothetical protein